MMNRITLIPIDYAVIVRALTVILMTVRAFSSIDRLALFKIGMVLAKLTLKRLLLIRII